MCSEENNVYPLTICADLRGGVHLGVAVKRKKKSLSLCALHTQAGGPPLHVNRSCLIELNGIRNAAALHPSPIYLSAKTHTHTNKHDAHLRTRLHTHGTASMHIHARPCTFTVHSSTSRHTHTRAHKHTHTPEHTNTHTHCPPDLSF